MKKEKITIFNLKKEIKKNQDKKRMDVMSRFFKTGERTYSEGDIFIGGLTNPVLRKIAKENKNADFDILKKLLKSKFHEERLLATFILVENYKNLKTNKKNEEKKRIVDFYLKNLNGINNWDIVDASAYQILGDYFVDNKRERKIIYELARNPDCQRISSLWKKRVGIISTYALIKNYELKDTIKISKILIKEEHDLIHKAVGWMLRELGKKDEKLLLKFLKENYAVIPRTTLRYAIEEFNEKKRKELLNGIFT